MNPAVIVMAKSPRPGRVKTRLCPPCSEREAGEIATAALTSTLEAVAGSRAAHLVIALEGAPGSWLPAGFDVIPQYGRGLAERLARAFEDVGGPAVAIGMDTPQATPDLIDQSFDALDEADSALGPTVDGGYWAIGLRRPNDRAFAGVPMSLPSTFFEQQRRLHQLGLSCRVLPELRDVDHFSDALAVASLIPESRFAAAVRAVNDRLDRASL